MKLSTESNGLLRTGSGTDAAGVQSANTKATVNTHWMMLLQCYIHTVLEPVG